jgi:hypothetical protein
MLVAPTPIVTLLLGFEPSILPIPLLTPLFHKPVAIGAILVFIPFVVITPVAIIITVYFRKTDHRGQQRTTQ